MKRLSTAAFTLVLAGFLVLPVAHAQKIGYANQEAILANMPEMSEVQKQLKREAQQQQQQLQKERKQLRRQMQQYQQQRSLLSDSAKTQRQRQLRQRQQQLQRSSRQRQQQLRKQERKLMQPLLKDLQSAIQTVSDRKGLDLVLRSRSLLNVNENSNAVVNISPEVAKELGIQLQQSPGGPAPTVEPGTGPTQGGGQ